MNPKSKVNTHRAIHGMGWESFLWQGFTLCVMALLLTGCNPQMPQPSSQPSRIETTISADGEMVAALDWPPPHGAPRLRIKRLLPQESPWEELPISPYISSIYFGMTGKQLLLTEVIDETLRSVLVSWDMDKPDSPPTLLYEGYRLDFPTEFKPGHYLVRSCNNERADRPCTQRVFSWQWEWVHNNQQVQLINRAVYPDLLLFSQPTIVGEQGFFWFDHDPKNSRFITLAFKGQQLDDPDIAFDESVRDIKCDRALQRCLHSFIQGLTLDRKFIYAFTTTQGSESCLVPKLAGFPSGFSITPDGRAAVAGWADGHDQPRRVVVIRFNPGQCAPDSVQLHPFEETSS